MMGRYLVALLLLSIVSTCSADDEGWTFHANEAPAERLRWTTPTDKLAPIRAAFASGKPEDFLAVFAVETEQERLDLLRLWLRLRHPSTGSGIRHYAVNADQTDYVFAGYMVMDERVWDERSAWYGPGFYRASPIIIRVEIAAGEGPIYQIRWEGLRYEGRQMELPESYAVRRLVRQTTYAVSDYQRGGLPYLELLHSLTGIDAGIAEAREQQEERQDRQAVNNLEERRGELLERHAKHYGLGTHATTINQTYKNADGRQIRAKRYTTKTRNRNWHDRCMTVYKPQATASAPWTDMGQPGNPYEWEWANVVHRVMGKNGYYNRLRDTAKIIARPADKLGKHRRIWRPLAFLSLQINGETYVCFSVRIVSLLADEQTVYVNDVSGWLVKDADGDWYTHDFGDIGRYLERYLMPHGYGRPTKLFAEYRYRWALDPEVPLAWRRELLPALLELPPGVDPGTPTAPPQPAAELSILLSDDYSPALDQPVVAPAGWHYAGMERGIRKRALSTPIHLGADQSRPLALFAPMLAALAQRDFALAGRYFIVPDQAARWAAEDFLRWLNDPTCTANILAYAYRDDESRLYLAGHAALGYDSGYSPVFFVIRADRMSTGAYMFRFMLSGRESEELPHFNLTWELLERRLATNDDRQILLHLMARVDRERQAIGSSGNYFHLWSKFFYGRDYDKQKLHVGEALREATAPREAAFVQAQPEGLEPASDYVYRIGEQAYRIDDYWCDPEQRATTVRQLPLTVLDAPVELREGEDATPHPDKVVQGFQQVFAAIQSGDPERLHAISEIRDATSADNPVLARYQQRLRMAKRQVLFGYVTMVLDGKLYFGCISRAYDGYLGPECQDIVTFIQQREDGTWLKPSMPRRIYAALTWLVCTPATKECDQVALVALYREFWGIAPTVPTEWREKLLPVLGKAY